MSTVRIPPVLRAQTGDLKAVELEGATVGAVLEALVERFPALREQLLGPDGGLHRFVNVYLNALATPVHERDTITVLPAMAGGAA